MTSEQKYPNIDREFEHHEFKDLVAELTEARKDVARIDYLERQFQVNRDFFEGEAPATVREAFDIEMAKEASENG